MKNKSTYATAMAKNVPTPQSQPIPGRETEQVKNSAGGYVFQTTPFAMLDRFLILGSDSPTYYATANKLTKDNSTNLQACLKLDGRKTVDQIVEISLSGRAPKNDPAIFALAVAATPEYSDAKTAAYALTQVNKVCRIGTHEMHFAEYLNGMRGWGRAVQTAFGEWYTNRSADKLAYQLIKYQNRDGWSHKDILKLAHVKSDDSVKSALLAWVAVGGSLDELKVQSESWTRTPKAKKGKTAFSVSPEEIALRRQRFLDAYNTLSSGKVPLLTAFEAAKKAGSVGEIVKLITDGGLTHEMIPTQYKTSPEVWEALLQNMPMTAMIRNLGNMTKIGLLKPLSAASKLVVGRLSDVDALKSARIHPLNVLLARGTYGQGRGYRGSGEWGAVATIVDALEEAFYASFNYVTPTGKSTYVGLDISGSMCSPLMGTPITCAQGAAVLGMTFARTEKNYCIYGFNHTMTDLKITAKDSLESACKKAGNWSGGGTDCAQPMIHAGKLGMEVDTFIVITDCETWAGKIHPQQVLKQYRKARGKEDVREIVVGMTATNFTIADPKDPYMLDIVGFDSSCPALISDFSRGQQAMPSVEDDAGE